MAKKEATEKELVELWEQVEKYWESLDDPLSYPWVEAKFKLSMFRTTLSLKSLRMPYRFGNL